MVCNRCLRNKVHAQFMGKQNITPEDWIFENGAGKGVVEESIEGDCPKKLRVLEKLTMNSGNKAFAGLTADMFTPQWEDFGMDDNMTNREMPGEWASKLTAFQQSEAKESAQRCAGGDSKKTMPLIFVLSAGADPTDYLVKLARDFEYEDRKSLGKVTGRVEIQNAILRN
eukprot:s1704_g1.t1